MPFQLGAGGGGAVTFTLRSEGGGDAAVQVVFGTIGAASVNVGRYLPDDDATDTISTGDMTDNLIILEWDGAMLHCTAFGVALTNVASVMPPNVAPPTLSISATTGGVAFTNGSFALETLTLEQPPV